MRKDLKMELALAAALSYGLLGAIPAFAASAHPATGVHATAPTAPVPSQPGPDGGPDGGPSGGGSGGPDGGPNG
ncbi:MAG: hypothetical protein ACREM8_02290 [Vulcanimicrobiaceae bacterium]